MIFFWNKTNLLLRLWRSYTIYVASETLYFTVHWCRFGSVCILYLNSCEKNCWYSGERDRNNWRSKKNNFGWVSTNLIQSFHCLFLFVPLLHVYVFFNSTFRNPSQRTMLFRMMRRNRTLLLVYTLYLVMLLVGAAIFNALEEFPDGTSWGYGNSLYFCIITLTTIGKLYPKRNWFFEQHTRQIFCGWW